MAVKLRSHCLVVVLSLYDTRVKLWWHSLIRINLLVIMTVKQQWYNLTLQRWVGSSVLICICILHFDCVLIRTNCMVVISETCSVFEFSQSVRMFLFLLQCFTVCIHSIVWHDGFAWSSNSAEKGIIVGVIAWIIAWSAVKVS